MDNGTSGTIDVNFGSPPYAISSGNADANGHGNFEYAVPSGYFALMHKKPSGVRIMAYTTNRRSISILSNSYYTGTGNSHAITLMEF